MSTSKLQRQVSRFLFTQFSEYTIYENSRPDWCLGDDLERLELDFWIVELDVAIEVQGEQHYNFVPYFHGNYASFTQQQQRDIAKKERCLNYGVTLIEIDDDLTYEQAVERIVFLSRQHRKILRSQDAEYWNREVRKLLRRYRVLFSQRKKLNAHQFAQRAGNYQALLSDWLSKYGLQILEFSYPGIRFELFWHVEKARQIVKLNRNINRKTRKERKLS